MKMETEEKILSKDVLIGLALLTILLGVNTIPALLVISIVGKIFFGFGIIVFLFAFISQRKRDAIISVFKIHSHHILELKRIVSKQETIVGAATILLFLSSYLLAITPDEFPLLKNAVNMTITSFNSTTDLLQVGAISLAVVGFLYGKHEGATLYALSSWSALSFVGAGTLTFLLTIFPHNNQTVFLYMKTAFILAGILNLFLMAMDFVAKKETKNKRTLYGRTKI